jgi:hypothetical protein
MEPAHRTTKPWWQASIEAEPSGRMPDLSVKGKLVVIPAALLIMVVALSFLWPVIK